MLLNIIITLILVVLSALFSGMTLGLMSLNVHALKRKVHLGNLDAIKIYPLRKQGNQLLCTLLLGNVTVNAVLSVFLGSITVGVVAVVVSTVLIVLFGEIIPQAIFSKHALPFGAKFIWLVYIFYYVFYPVTKPLAMGLDKLLGGELPTVFSKKELMLFLDQHKKTHRTDIDHDELEILKGGLAFSEKKVKDVMTKRSDTYFIEQGTILTKVERNNIRVRGHSRIPVYNKKTNKIVGVLYSKDLINISPEEQKSVKDVMRRKILIIKDTANLDDVLNMFRKKKIHLFIVADKTKNMVGIITLEDVLEEIVGEIVDEYDILVKLGKNK